MDRRHLIALFSGAALASPIEVRGQQPGRTYRLGVLSPLRPDAPQYVALFEELRRLGFAEGQNLTIDPRGFGLRDEQLPQAAIALVDTRVDVIQAGGDPAIRAAQQATATLPILGNTVDMIGEGLVRSMAHPGGNTTGVSSLGTELDGKRLEMLIELIPGARRIAVLADPRLAGSDRFRSLQAIARAKAVALDIRTVAKPDEIGPAIDAADKAGAAGLSVLASPLFFTHRRLILEPTAALSLPAMYHQPAMAREGGLVAYSPNYVEIYRRQISRALAALLRGTRPADLPVEQPTKFELVINLKTAKALGLTVPPILFAQADEIIE